MRCVFWWKIVGVEFPDELRDAYLLHDGCNAFLEFNTGLYFFVPYGWWCSLDSVVKAWESNCRVIDSLEASGDGDFYVPEESWGDLKVRPEWRSKKWIPIGLTGTSSCMLIDMNPGPKGVKGQLLKDFGDGEAQVVASSFNDYLSIFIKSIENNLISYLPDGWVSVATGDSVYDIHNIPT
jgi:cell wall assembly regulator SMI1